MEEFNFNLNTSLKTESEGSQEKKKADFAASLHSLNYNIDELVQKLDPDVDLELKPKEVYRNTDLFKNVPEDQFNNWYKGIETAFNAFEQNKNFDLSDPFVNTLFDTPFSRALKAKNPELKIGANIKQEFDLNPFFVSKGLSDANQFHQGNSVDEVAQRNTRIKDYKNNKWIELGEPVGNLGTYLGFLDRGLMIATDEKGMPKLDEYGRTYYETIDGRDTSNKRHLIAKADNFLTQEGSFLNAIDPFDSDQIEKNTTRSLIKNTLKIGSLFLPFGIGKVIAGTTAILNLGEMFSEGWKTFNALTNKLSGGEYKTDDDVEERANNIANISRSLTWGSQTEEEQKDQWSIASLSNVLADGISQISTQRLVAQAPVFARTLVDPKFRKALEAGDKSAQAFLNTSKNIARAYMTGQAAMEVGEAFEQAGLDKSTKDLAMGIASLAFGALYKTAPFDWMLEGVGLNAVQKATKKVIEKEVKDLAQAMAIETSKKALTEVEKKAILAKGISAIQNKVKDFMSKTSFKEGITGASSEFLEESTEFVAGEAIKKGFEFLGKNNLIKADSEALKKLDPFGENFLEELAFSGVAGAMSGGAFGLAQDIKLRKSALDINSLADISQNGYTDFALNELEKLRTLGKKGKGLLSDKLSTEIDRIENNMPVYKPTSSGTTLTSQNDYVINTVKQQLLATHFALQGIGADKEGLDEKLKNANELFKTVYADAKNSSLLEDAKQISKELVSTKMRIDELKREYQKKKENSTNDKELDDELRFKLAPLEKKEKALTERYEELARVGKEKSELAEDYLRESLYKVNPFAWVGFDIKSKSDFVDGKVGEELVQAEREWEDYRLTRRNSDIKKAYNEAKDIFNNSELFKKVKDPANNIDNLVKNQEVEYLIHKLKQAQISGNKEEEKTINEKLEKIFEDPSFSPTQDVLNALKFDVNFLLPEINQETFEVDYGLPSKENKNIKKLSGDFSKIMDSIKSVLKQDTSLMYDKEEGGIAAPNPLGEEDLEAMLASNSFEEFIKKYDDPKLPEYNSNLSSRLGKFASALDPDQFDFYLENKINGTGPNIDDYLKSVEEKLRAIYDQVKSIQSYNLSRLEDKLKKGNKKSPENIAKNIKLPDVEQVIKENYDLYEQDPKNYRDPNPSSDSSITKQLENKLKEVKKLKGTLQIPFAINPVVHRAKKLNPDKFSNPELDFEFTDVKQFFYLENYLSNLQLQLEDLLEKLKQNQEGDIKVIRLGFIKGASKLIKNIAAANKISHDAIGFEDLHRYTSMDDDQILSSETLNEDAAGLYSVLIKLGEILKEKSNSPEGIERHQKSKREMTKVGTPDLKDYEKSYIFFEEALRRGDYKEFLEKLHKVKESLNKDENNIKIPTFEQEFVIFQAYSLIQAARDGNLNDPVPTDQENPLLNFYNSIFIDGRPGIGKSDIIIRYLFELLNQDSGINVHISSKNDSVALEVLSPKFGAENVKTLSELGFDASQKVSLTNAPIGPEGFIHPFLPHQRKPNLTTKEPKVRLKDVYIIDEATHLNTALVKQMSERDNAVFIFLGDTTQDGASETLTDKIDDVTYDVIEPFFQYTPGMERVPRITLSLRNSTENYDYNASKLEKLVKQLYGSPIDKYQSIFDNYTKNEENALNFVYTEDNTETLIEGVKISDNPVEETRKIIARLSKINPDAKIAVISDNGERNAEYPPTVRLLTSSTIQGQEFDYVIIDNISFSKDPLEKTRKLNTLLSRYREGMILPSSIKDIYPTTSNKKEGAISKFVVLTPEMLKELRDFSLNLTKDFKTESSKKTSSSVVDDEGFAVFEENEEDFPERKPAKRVDTVDKTYLYFSFPNDIFSITLNDGSVLESLSGKQKFLLDIRDLDKEKFQSKYGDVKFQVNKISEEEYSVDFYKGKEKGTLLKLPKRKYLSQPPALGEVPFESLKELLAKGNIFNNGYGKSTNKPLGEVKREMDERGMAMSMPIIINMSPLQIKNEVDYYFSSHPYSSIEVGEQRKIKEKVVKDIIGLQGKAIVFQSSDPQLKDYIENLNKYYDDASFDDFSTALIKAYIKHSIQYHSGLREDYNISIGFVKRPSKKTVEQYVTNSEDVFKKRLDPLPRLSRSELRRYGTLVYNYMRYVAETNDNPMSDPVFAKFVNWKHGDGLYFIHQGTKLQMQDERKSALELLFGFGYDGEFYEVIPEQKIEDGKPVVKKETIKGKEVELPVIEYKRYPLRDKTNLPQKLKPYTKKAINPFSEVFEFQYEQIVDDSRVEIKQYSLMEALAGIDTYSGLIFTDSMISFLKNENNKPDEKPKKLKELLDFTFKYQMEEAIPYYSIPGFSGLYALRVKEDESDLVSHNELGRFPVIQVPVAEFSKTFSSYPVIKSSDIVKSGPPESTEPKSTPPKSTTPKSESTEPKSTEPKKETPSVEMEEYPYPEDDFYSHFSEDGEGEVPKNSFDNGNLNPKPDTESLTKRWYLSKEMYNSIISTGYVKTKKGKLKPKLTQFDKTRMAELIYGANSEKLQMLGVKFLNDEVLRPIFYYDYKTGEVLPDVYSEEGVVKFNENIQKLLSQKKETLRRLLELDDAESDEFFVKLQELMLDSKNNIELETLIAEYLTLQNLQHIINFNLYPDISDVLGVDMSVDEEGNVTKVFIPQNRIPDVTYDKESSDRGGIQSSSAFTKAMIQRLPRINLVKVRNENNEIVETPVISKTRKSNYKEVSKWLNDIVYNSEGELLDSQGNVDAKKLKDLYEKVLNGVTIKYDKEGVVNLYLLLFNEETETSPDFKVKPFVDTEGNKIYSLSQAVKSAQYEAVRTGNLEKAKIIQNVKTATNLFSKIKWLSVTSVDEVSIVDQDTKERMDNVYRVISQLNNAVRTKSFDDALRTVYQEEELETIKSSKNSVIEYYKNNPDEFKKLKGPALATFVQEVERVLENNKVRAISSTASNVNGDSINITGTKNISRDIENIARITEQNYEKFSKRVC